MINRIKRDALNLDHPAYKKNEIAYNVIFRVIEDPEALILQSKAGDFFAVQNAGKSMWIWYDENMDAKKLENYMANFMERIKEVEIPGFSGLSGVVHHVAEYISKVKNCTFKESMCMIAYECVHSNNIEIRDEMIQGKQEHLDIVMSFIQSFIEESHGEIVTLDKIKGNCQNMIDSGSLYFLEHQGEIVSMAYYAHKTDKFCRINSVYTPKKKRGRGYASSLVCMMTDQLLKENIRPMLYTDKYNPTSNKIYIAIGYEEKGRVDHLEFIKRH